MIRSTAAARPLLLLDFDGTVCTGDDPVLAYAAAAADLVGERLPEVGATAGRELHHQLESYLSGHPEAPRYADGYAAVAHIAARLAPGSSDDVLERAYASSRAALAAGRLEVEVPPGLVDLLRGLAGRVDRVLVTNAPRTGVDEALVALGLTDVLDEVVTSAGKPAGWDALLPRLLGGRPAASALSVGDVWANDLAAPLRAGCSTALVDRFGHAAGPAHLTAPDLPGLYAGITTWAEDPAAFQGAHPLAVTSSA
ncbi:HAD family hydrolase [Quadrisphaera oryzae]|uniref:HAD family hydrolase n=1 Tax=Quadrisphaera TaxID=317661 RepID=UPI001646C0E1|nr:HAD family hydrolase [Quadrisphaera sp. RL12-1S]MBC3763393.1 HAD family hydrolase [Quadrisphaera sp. RL12-1S]